MLYDFGTFHSSMRQNTFQIGFHLHFSLQSRENAFTHRGLSAIHAFEMEKKFLFHLTKELQFIEVGGEGGSKLLFL